MFKWLSKLFTREPATFADWFRAQNFRHFQPEEFEQYFRRPKNSYPPREMWGNIVPTLRILDDLRATLGPIRVTSSYRSPAYNDMVGGMPRSFHKQFIACDIQCDGATPHEVYTILKAWRDAGKFKGGLGLYQTFVHVDTRGYNADW